MTRVGYLDLVGGASGDMLLGALLDAGLSTARLEEELGKLPVDGFTLEVSRGRRGGVSGTHVRVLIGEDSAHTWADFADAIDGSTLSASTKTQSLAVFRHLEEAERRAHRIGPEETPPHLHELGSLDTLVDVVGVVAGLEALGVTELYASPLPLGAGVVASQHGAIPAAAPATLELAAMAAAPVRPAGQEGETVTPTGAALLTTLASFHRPTLNVQSVGYGLGTRDPAAVPNVVALWLGEEVQDGQDGLVLLETNIDDMSPQVYGHVQEMLLELGALDVWLTPIQMKKGRPGVLLSVLASDAMEQEAVDLLLRETTTLGVRTRRVRRHVAQREVREVETSLGRVPVKVKYLEGRPVAATPEYEACRALARARGIPLQSVLRQVEAEARVLLEEWEGVEGWTTTCACCKRDSALPR